MVKPNNMSFLSLDPPIIALISLPKIKLNISYTMYTTIQPARIVRGNDDIDKDEIRDDCDNIDDHQAGREEEGGGSSDSDWVGISEVFHSIIIWI